MHEELGRILSVPHYLSLFSFVGIVSQCSALIRIIRLPRVASYYYLSFFTIPFDNVSYCFLFNFVGIASYCSRIVSHPPCCFIFASYCSPIVSHPLFALYLLLIVLHGFPLLLDLLIHYRQTLSHD